MLIPGQAPIMGAFFILKKLLNFTQRNSLFITMNQKECKECGRLLFGRSDKKFCNDTCRSAFNNREKADQINFVRRVNEVLRRNRSILDRLTPNGRSKTTRDRLAREGFHFEYFTSTYRTRAGDEYRFCYDLGYLELGNSYVLLVRKNDQ